MARGTAVHAGPGGSDGGVWGWEPRVLLSPVEADLESHTLVCSAIALEGVIHPKHAEPLHMNKHVPESMIYGVLAVA